MAGKKSWPASRASLFEKMRRTDDDQAWTDFVDIYGPLVKWQCERFKLSPADADDVVQDVFFKISGAIQRFRYDPEKGRFRDWLRRITRNCTIDHYNLKRRVGLEQGIGGEGFPFDAHSENGDSAWIEIFGATVLKTAFERIAEEFDPETWKAFELGWIEHRQPGEIADELRKGTAWVYKAKFKVKSRLEAEVKYLCSDTASLQKP